MHFGSKVLCGIWGKIASVWWSFQCNFSLAYRDVWITSIPIIALINFWCWSSVLRCSVSDRIIWEVPQNLKNNLIVQRQKID